MPTVVQNCIYCTCTSYKDDLQELDSSTVNELIHRIVIHSPEKTGERKHVTIEIYFTYVGKIRIPLHKPEPVSGTEKPA